MKKILVSLLVTVAAGASLWGATSAYFSDTAVSENYTVSTGTLDIVANNDPDDVFTIALGAISNLAPGEKTPTSTIEVKNVGSIKAATFGKFTYSGPLADKLVIWNYSVTYYKADGTPSGRVDNFITEGAYTMSASSFNLAYGNKLPTLKSWVDGYGPLDVPATAWDMEGMRPDERYVITYNFKLDESAGNNLQNTSANVGYIVHATQINTQAILDLPLGGLYDDQSYVDANVVNAYLVPQTN